MSVERIFLDSFEIRIKKLSASVEPEDSQPSFFLYRSPPLDLILTKVVQIKPLHSYDSF
jgi:hypothetical protein